MSSSPKMTEYSPKSFVVRKPGRCRIFNDNMKNMNGRWNNRLKGGGGWIFSNKNKVAVQAYLEEYKKNQLSTIEEKGESESESSESESSESESSESESSEFSEDEETKEEITERYEHSDMISNHHRDVRNKKRNLLKQLEDCKEQLKQYKKEEEKYPVDGEILNGHPTKKRKLYDGNKELDIETQIKQNTSMIKNTELTLTKHHTKNAEELDSFKQEQTDENTLMLERIVELEIEQLRFEYSKNTRAEKLEEIEEQYDLMEIRFNQIQNLDERCDRIIKFEKRINDLEHQSERSNRSNSSFFKEIVFIYIFISMTYIFFFREQLDNLLE